jgi:hypothetical protein
MIRARTSVLVTLALGCALVGLAHAGAQEGQFTVREIADLDRGELVTRPHSETRAGRVLVGGTSYQAIERPRADVWRAIHDVAAWRHMLPQTAETRLDSGHGPSELVFVRHAYGIIQASYTLRVTFEEHARRATFDVEQGRPHDVRSAHGFLEVRAYPNEPERCLLVWALLADPGDNPLVTVLIPEIQAWSLRVPTTMRNYLQGSGAGLYQH